MDTIKIQDTLSFTTGFDAQDFSANEDVDYSSVEFQSGYGQLSSAGAIVQKGVKGTISINLKITSYSESSYTAVMKEITNTVSDHDRMKLQESIQNKDYGSWWGRLFGIASGHSSEHYLDKTHDTVHITDTKIKNSIEQHMSKDFQEFSISGDFTIEGQSSVPTAVQMYIKTLKIKTSNGNIVSVISNNAVAADTSGNVQPSQGKIKFV